MGGAIPADGSPTSLDVNLVGRIFPCLPIHSINAAMGDAIAADGAPYHVVALLEGLVGLHGGSRSQA